MKSVMILLASIPVLSGVNSCENRAEIEFKENVWELVNDDAPFDTCLQYLENTTLYNMPYTAFEKKFGKPTTVYIDTVYRWQSPYYDWEKDEEMHVTHLCEWKINDRDSLLVGFEVVEDKKEPIAIAGRLCNRNCPDVRFDPTMLE